MSFYKCYIPITILLVINSKVLFELDLMKRKHLNKFKIQRNFKSKLKNQKIKKIQGGT